MSSQAFVITSQHLQIDPDQRSSIADFAMVQLQSITSLQTGGAVDHSGVNNSGGQYVGGAWEASSGGARSIFSLIFVPLSVLSSTRFSEVELAARTSAYFHLVAHPFQERLRLEQRRGVHLLGWLPIDQANLLTGSGLPKDKRLERLTSMPIQASLRGWPMDEQAMETSVPGKIERFELGLAGIRIRTGTVSSLVFLMQSPLAVNADDGEVLRTGFERLSLGFNAIIKP